MIRQRFGTITPDQAATVLHTMANDLTKIGVLSVVTEPARFHALMAAAEMMTAVALELDAHFDAQADAEAAEAEGRHPADVCEAEHEGFTCTLRLNEHGDYHHACGRQGNVLHSWAI